MTTELTKFKRYTDLLEKVYNTGTQATPEDIMELNGLGYELELNGVSDTVFEMNYNRLEQALELEQR